MKPLLLSGYIVRNSVFFDSNKCIECISVKNIYDIHKEPNQL